MLSIKDFDHLRWIWHGGNFCKLLLIYNDIILKMISPFFFFVRLRNYKWKIYTFWQLILALLLEFKFHLKIGVTNLLIIQLQAALFQIDNLFLLRAILGQHNREAWSQKNALYLMSSISCCTNIDKIVVFV